jgi:DUF4097 and DUF4098 domain-containing protein YvlB
MKNVASCVAVLALAAAPTAFAGQAEDIKWSGRVAKGQQVEVKGVNGGITVEAATGDAVELRAERSARRSDPAAVQVKVVEHAGGVTICALYPTPDGERPNECAPGKGGRVSTRDNDTKVEFTVRVPAGVRFAGQTVNGGIAVNGLSADVEARTVNGGIQIETSGLAQAETVNGGVNVQVGRADWTGTARFRAVNGGVTVALPANASTEVHAKTVNGAIDTDFPLTVTGRIAQRSLNGTIGSGGRTLELETVNGGIALRKK